jgi:glycosyltransferase involved in cell wall biosynthesis
MEAATNMKLLLATYNLPPERYGGTEVYLESLVAELRRNYSVELLAGSPGEPPELAPGQRFHLAPGSCWDVPAWRLTLDGARYTMPELYTTRCSDLRAYWVEWLSQRAPDLLHIHGYSLTVSLSLMEAAAELRIPIVSTLHNVPLLCPRGDFVTWRGEICDGRAELLKCMHCTAATRSNALGGVIMAAATPLLSLLPVPASTAWSPLRSAWHYPGLLRMHLDSKREMLQIARRWHVFSEWSRQALILNGAPPERIVLLRHPLPASRMSHDSRISHVSRSGPLRLGFFGRFNRFKGLSTLLDAVRRVPDAALQLELYGKAQDSNEARVEAQVRAAAASDSRILWHGQIAQSEQPAALARLDALVVPSVWIETGPLTVLEAFAAGVPVLGSDLSGINEWVREGENGWLFPPGDSVALAAKIAQLCANPSLLEQARRFPAIDSTAVHAARVMEIYESVLAAVPASRPGCAALQESRL